MDDEEDEELTPQEVAALDQLLAGISAISAKLQMTTALVQSIGEQGTAFLARIRQRDVARLLSHPDVAELDAQFDGFYDAPSGGTQA